MADDDFSEVLALAGDLSSAGADVNRFAGKAIEVTARSIKDDWRQQADRSGLHPYAAAVDYEMRYPGDAVEALIGPNLGKPQGAMGFVDEGGADVRSEPQHAARDAVRANEDDFQRGLEIALLDSLEQ